jgi:hypothetical protein
MRATSEWFLPALVTSKGSHLPNQLLKVTLAGMSCLLSDSHQYAWACYKGRFTPWTTKRTMEDGVFPWSNFMVQLPWSDFLKYQFTKPLGPSLGVNQIWAKRNDHAPKSECVDSFKICPKRKFRKKMKFDHSFVFTLPFSYHSTSFAPPTTKPVRPCQWVM